MWHILDSQEWVLPIPGRRLNPFFALAEVVWMWSGKGGAEFITYYNKNIAQFQDPGVPYFHGAYGRRVRHYGYSEQPLRNIPYTITCGELPSAVDVDQLQHIRRKIEADPDTRQGVVVLWDPVKDNFVQSNDHPCNNVLYFSKREGKLNVTIVMRSNDVIWGTPYNMIQFSHLHALMAGTLGLEVGDYNVMVNNIHFYVDQYPSALHATLGWMQNVDERKIDLKRVSEHVFKEPWDMRWNLDEFDQFVSQVWDHFEKRLRTETELYDLGSDAGVVNAAFQSIQVSLDDQMERFDVPEYWTHLFHVLFLFHCRKAGANTVYNTVLETLPRQLKWLILDFTNRG
jgi:thymidylate synthase